MNENKYKNIISHAKEYGFVFQSSEIYDGLGAVYDYGPYGVELKNNIKNHWWRALVQLHDNIVGLDAAILMHPTVWKASGHIDSFRDPLIDNKDSKNRYRADALIEVYIEKTKGKVSKEVEKAAKKFGDAFDREKFLTTNPQTVRWNENISSIQNRLNSSLVNNNMAELRQIIADCDIADPETGSRNWTDVRQFNLMFSTQFGSVSDEATNVYLRPETAQGIFVNFINVQKSARMKIPFGIAQAGKAFRNEIVARQFLFRMKEFEQMEMQFFVKPGEEMKWYDHWKNERMNWHLSFGFPRESLRFHEHANLAHYANAAVDIEYEFPMGFRELEGIHSRTDFDLKQHEKHSGKKMQYFDNETGEAYIPFVVETSMGLDRMFFALLSQAYTEEQLEDGSTRVVLKIPPVLAPLKAAVLPLVKKDRFPEIAQKIFSELKSKFNCFYEEKDTIGRRYRRQDAIGTPFCITIDNLTKEDGTVTLRHRDSMKQERLAAAAVEQYIQHAIHSH